jgi:hypothetical protein
MHRFAVSLLAGFNGGGDIFALPIYNPFAAFNEVLGSFTDSLSTLADEFLALDGLGAEDFPGFFAGFWSEQNTNRNANTESEEKVREFSFFVHACSLIVFSVLQ